MRRMLGGAPLILFSLLLLNLVFISSQARAADTVVLNGSTPFDILSRLGVDNDFEKGDFGQPTNAWKKYVSGASTVGLDAANKTSGANGLKLHSQNGVAEAAFYLGHPVIDPGHRYVLRFWAKTDAKTGLNMTVFLRSGGKEYNLDLHAQGAAWKQAAAWTYDFVPANSAWKQYAIDFTMPSVAYDAAAYLGVAFQSDNGGDAWIDQATLQPKWYEAYTATGTKIPNVWRINWTLGQTATLTVGGQAGAPKTSRTACVKPGDYFLDKTNGALYVYNEKNPESDTRPFTLTAGQATPAPTPPAPTTPTPTPPAPTSPTPTTPAPTTPTTQTRTVTRMYQGPFNTGDVNQQKFLANNYQMYVSDLGQSAINSIESQNKNLQNLYYFNMKGIKTAQPFYQTCVKENLFWRTSNGSQVRNTVWNWYLTDIRNPRWAQIVIEYLKPKMAYYDGVMLDETQILWMNDYTGTPAGYSEATFYAAVEKFITDIRQAFPNKRIICNGYRRLTSYNGMSLVDKGANGISYEGMAYRLFSGGYVGKETLQKELTDFDQIVRVKNKEACFLEYGNASDRTRRMFALGNYLLVGNQNAYYFYVAGDVGGIIHLPEFDLDLGVPTAPMSTTSSGLWYRPYTKGIVLVNPGSSTISHQLDASYQRLSISGGGTWNSNGSLSWSPVAGSVSLAPQTAVVLRK